MEFDDLLADFLLALPDDAFACIPHDITIERLVQMYLEVYEQVRSKLMELKSMEAAATANPCDDAIQTPTVGRKG